MIVSKQAKIAVFLTPKTGTLALCRATYGKVDVVRHEHENLPAFEEIAAADSSYGDPSLYTMFAFYRDPLDRALSMLRYIKRWRTHDFFHAFYGNEIKMSSFEDNPYDSLTPELKALNDSVPLIEVFRKMSFERDDMYARQVFWLDYPNIQLLNYHNYAAEVKRLGNYLGININGETVHNPSVKIEHLDYLSADDIQEIKEYYEEDYRFFRDRNIYIPSA